MADRDSRLTVIREHSTVAVHRFAPASFDYVYIDADHTYEAAARDINLYAPIVRPGGILAGHDYANAGGAIPFGVKRAVDEYVIRNNLRDRVHISPDRPHSWFIVMP
jgi:predicted O-methyltransferase YrrM